MNVVYLHRRKIDNIVFYVGIGTRKRAFLKNNRNHFWKRVVQSHDYYVEITHDNLIREEAEVIEKYLIEFYKNLYPNKLTNITGGGDGWDTSSSIEANKKRWSNPDEKQKIIQANKKRFSNPEERQKIVEANKKRFSNPEERQKIVEANKKRFSNPEERQKVSERFKKLLSTPEARQKLSERVKKIWQKRKNKEI